MEQCTDADWMECHSAVRGISKQTCEELTSVANLSIRALEGELSMGNDISPNKVIADIMDQGYILCPPKMAFLRDYIQDTLAAQPALPTIS